MSGLNFVSFVGLFIFIGLAFCVSSNRQKINWRLVSWGLGIQLFIALFVFYFPFGTKFFLIINHAVIKIMESARAGSEFLFGVLALAPGTVNAFGQKSIGFLLAFQALPTIIFFSSLISILYYFKVMPKVIKLFSRIFAKSMKISGAESLAAASNIFVGVESALTIKPYLSRMTPSELCVVLTACLSTVASNILAVYVFSLQNVFPTIAGHLVSASLLSAPAAVLMAKILVPETDQPETMGQDVNPHSEKTNSVIDAILSGANSGLKMIAGIAALLIAVLGLVALADLILGFLGGKVNQIVDSNFEWSLKKICGILFYPFTFVTGVHPKDVGIISQIIGERLIVTEVVSYQDLAQAISSQSLHDPRSAVIATYALCGFTHFASMAIFVGGISALVPEKTRELSQICFRALLGATLACMMTACMAGLFYSDQSILFSIN